MAICEANNICFVFYELPISSGRRFARSRGSSLIIVIIPSILRRITDLA